MSMPNSTAGTKTFTLSDLAKIALGAPELTREHLSVLQSLLIMLMQKLNCHNETVRIHGFPATCLRKLLGEMSANNTEYDFETKTLKGFKEKYELLEKLEQQTRVVETKIEQHFEEIRNCNKTFIFKSEIWDHYAAPDEDLCTYYMPENQELCLLFRDTVFNRALRRRSTYPLIQHLKIFESNIEEMAKKISTLTEELKEAEPKLNSIKLIIEDIETFRPSLKKKYETFREAMIEAQEMLNCKVERVALPALRKFLEERFINVEKCFKNLRAETNKCQLWKALTIGKSTCISCSIYDEQKYLHRLKPIQTLNRNEECFCNNVVREATILEKLDRLTALNTLLNMEANRSFCMPKRNTKTKNTGILKIEDQKVVEPELEKIKGIKQDLKMSHSAIGLKESREWQKSRKLKSVGLSRRDYAHD